MSSHFGWEDWQLEILDDYILGYSNFETQKELAESLGKNLNSVKIRLSRRKREIDKNMRSLSKDEYLTILSNRFSRSTEDMAKILNLSTNFILDKMDELDCLECKEFLLEGFENRPITNDEYELFIKLHKIKKMSKIQVAHILNRNIKTIKEMALEYETI